MLSKPLLTFAALGVVSLWYLRSRAAAVSALMSSSYAHSLRPRVRPEDSPDAAEHLQHSHALGVRNGIEGPVGPEPQ